MPNNDIKLEARGNGISLWRIAQALGISEPTMTRKLRKELSAEEKTKIRSIIHQLREDT